MKFVVVLTFLSGITGHPQQAVVRCDDAFCADTIMAYANESRQLSRLRVWEEEQFAPFSVGDVHVTYAWPPFVDRWYQ